MQQRKREMWGVLQSERNPFIWVLTRRRPDCTVRLEMWHIKYGHKDTYSTFLLSLSATIISSAKKNDVKKENEQIKPDLWLQSSSNAPVIFGQTKFTKQYVLINGFSPHLFGHDFKELRLWVILDYAKRTPCTNTYQFHFFVLPMIFMPNPTAPYLCSQLASVTKGLCKPLLQANRFLPTSEETASYAAPICPPGMHKNMSPIFFFFFLTCFNSAFQREVERKEENTKQESKQKQAQNLDGHSHSVSLSWLHSKVSSPLHLGVVWTGIWRLKQDGGWLSPELDLH